MAKKKEIITESKEPEQQITQPVVLEADKRYKVKSNGKSKHLVKDAVYDVSAPEAMLFLQKGIVELI